MRHMMRMEMRSGTDGMGPCGRRRPDGHGSGIVFGLLVVAAGVLLLLDRMNVIHVGDITNLWPSLIAGFGLMKLLHRPASGPRIVIALLLIGVGTLLQLNKFGYVSTDIHTIWPILVIAGGLLIMWTSLLRKRYHQTTVTENQLNKYIVFGGDESKVTTKQFEGGAVTAIFAGVTLDMRQAEMAAEECALNLSAVFGGIELKVPAHWEVVVHGAPLLGGFDNKTSLHAESDAVMKRKLIINGSAILGGVEIKN